VVVAYLAATAFLTWNAAGRRPVAEAEAGTR
jgi:hypothetical protein